MKPWCLALLALSLLGCATPSFQDGPQPHAYAFDQPELLATQRTFGVGNAVTLLGDACIDDAAASASYTHWLSLNQTVLREMTAVLAKHYRISASPDELQKRVAENMHLQIRLSLSDTALANVCASLPDTLALPSMNLIVRYQAVLAEVKNPDYLKPQRQALPEVKTSSVTPSPTIENSHD